MKFRNNLKLIKGGTFKAKTDHYVFIEGLPLVNLTENEKEMAQFFPLFGKIHLSPQNGKSLILPNDLSLLNSVILKHKLDCIAIGDIEDRVTVRTFNCLRKNNIKRLNSILMIPPKEILKLRDIGWKPSEKFKR